MPLRRQRQQRQQRRSGGGGRSGGGRSGGGGGGSGIGGLGGGLSSSLTKVQIANDPQSDYLRQLGKIGVGAFGSVDYNDWLQNDAYGMVDSLYGMSILDKPKLRREAFHKEIFGDPRAEQVFGAEGFAPYNAQKNPRDFFGAQAQAAGINLNGQSPMERWYNTSGYDAMAQNYGAANQLDPKLTWQQFAKPRAFRTSL